MTIDKQALRKELSNPAIGSNHHLRKLALSLLDELEARDKHIAELEKSKESWAELAGDIEQMRKQWADSAIEIGRFADEKDKRIAELEARIYIPQPLNIEDEYQNYEYVAGWNDCRNTTACRFEHTDHDAGIGVKGE